jgi:hypothetical protein
MKPDRSNYEIWFTDWLDGNLSREQVEEFKVFLNENHDLREELNGINMVSLEPPDLFFRDKDSIKKSFENLSDSQFENLCIASLENDLTPGQKAELNNIIVLDPIKRKSFELVQKLKLKPFAATFKRKNSVKRLTAGQRILKFSVIGLSAAATITILVLAYLFLPGVIEKETIQTTQNITSDTLLLKIHPAIIIKETEAAPGQGSLISEIKNTISEPLVSRLNVTLAEQVNQEEPDSITGFYREEPLISLAIPVPDNILNTFRPSTNDLQAFVTSIIPPLTENDRSNVDRFVAKLFHELIMRDTISGDRPVETYELAIAGITGLNKLFGWEMDLYRNTGETGEVKSYYFSSKMVKFNAPVKKTGNEM